MTGGRQGVMAKVGFEFGLGEWAECPEKSPRKISQINEQAYLKKKLQMEAIVTELLIAIISKEVQNEKKWQVTPKVPGWDVKWERWARRYSLAGGQRQKYVLQQQLANRHARFGQQVHF